MTEEKKMAFSAELSEMDLDAVNARLAADAVEVRDSEDLELIAEKTEQKEMLLERKSELEDLEKRTAAAAEIAEAAVETNTIERKEPETMEERVFTPDTVEYRDAYMKSLMGKSMSIEERTALTVAANVIPTETLNKIYGKLEDADLIKEVDVLHIPGYVSIPVATTVYDAAWTAMGTAALTARKLIKTIEITADIQAMSIPAFQTWLVNKLASKMEVAICAAIVNGGGSSANAPVGVGQCGITKYASGLTNPGIDDLSAFMGTLKSAYHRGAVWVMSSKTFFTLIQALPSDSNAVFVQAGMNPMLLGHKVIFDDACDSCKFKSGSTADSANCDHIIFGNFKNYVFNFGEGIAIEADSSVAFRTGSTVYRGMALCDGNVVDKDAFVWSVIAAS